MLHMLHAATEVKKSVPKEVQKFLPQAGSVYEAEKGWLSMAINTCFHRCCTVTDFRAATFNEEVITAADGVKFCFC